MTSCQRNELGSIARKPQCEWFAHAFAMLAGAARPNAIAQRRSGANRRDHPRRGLLVESA
eukprot:4324417-Pyramimonas_sp.AAC.1